MEIHQLRYFVATAEAGSVSRAAMRCHVAQPSLSQQLRRLEATLGTELFDRQARGVVLTDAGRALLPRARRILAEVHDVETNLERDVDEGRGILTVGAIPTMAPYLMPPALGKLRQELPACEIVLREDFTDALVEALLDNQLDCAITSLPIDHELLRAEELGREDLLVVVPEGSPIGEEGSVSLAELRDQPLIRLEEMHCLSQQVEQFCNAKRLASHVVCRTTQLETILAFVTFGVGLSIVPEMAAASDPTIGRGGGRRYARVKGAKVDRAIAMTWRKDRSRPKAALRLTEIIREQLTSGRHRIAAVADDAR